MNVRQSKWALLACCVGLLCAAGQITAFGDDPETQEQADALSAPLAIMDTPLDGSSVEAFEAGMERVREQASGADYKRLESAIKYLLFYDLSVRKDPAKLYRKLDGKTPDQIVAMTPH